MKKNKQEHYGAYNCRPHVRSGKFRECGNVVSDTSSELDLVQPEKLQFVAGILKSLFLFSIFEYDIVH